MPPVKNVGKPCAGEPHARFDGRGLETGPQPAETAPVPDPPHSLTDQGNLANQSCALVVPARAGLVAAAPVQPVPGGAGRWWVGEQAPGFWDGECDHSGVGG